MDFVLNEIPLSNNDEALKIVQSAKNCSATWKQTPLSERQALCRRVIEEFEKAQHEISVGNNFKKGGIFIFTFHVCLFSQVKSCSLL